MKGQENVCMREWCKNTLCWELGNCVVWGQSEKVGGLDVTFIIKGLTLNKAERGNIFLLVFNRPK